ncbi:MAG: molecular chaperone DnaJ [Spirochaetales bacterium]|nr:molecular chaperone DnaJ [Spirochaetales bacterium]
MLDVEPTCTASDIRRAFRKKAKAFHPDLKPSGKNAAMMRMLITAYKVLSDPVRRLEYDRTNRAVIYRSTFDYREFLRKRQDDPESMAKAIFFDLLHDNDDEAIELYDRLVNEDNFDITRYLDREDYMDCAFLLAEEYDRRRDYQKAYGLLISVAIYEQDKPYFRHFFREVIDKLRHLSCIRFPRTLEHEDLLDVLEELVSFNFSDQDSAFFLKKMAEVYADERKYELARDYLERGLARHAKLPGVKKLKDRLTFVRAE